MKALHWISSGIIIITLGIITISSASISSLYEKGDTKAYMIEADSLKSYSISLRGLGHGSEIIKDTIINNVEETAEFIEDSLSSTSITLRGEGHGNEIISDSIINTRADSEDTLSSTSVTLRGEGHNTEIKIDEIMNRTDQLYPAPPHKKQD